MRIITLPLISGIAGILGPITFIVVFTILGQVTPGYSAVNQVISNLELGEIGWIQQLNFLQMGTLIVVFALGFRRKMRGIFRRRLGIASALLTISGLGMVDAAFFTPAFPIEHSLGFLFFMIPLLIAMFVIGWEFSHNTESRNLGLFSLANGFLVLLLLLYFFAQGASAPVGGVPGGLIGVVNRIFVVLALSFFCVIGSRLVRSA